MLARSSTHEYWWQKLSEDELLKVRFCDLKLSLDRAPFRPLVEKLFQELKEQGIGWRPGVWISDEWFCPDGVAGLAVPFYLLHPRLSRLHKKYAGYVEGTTSEAFMKLIRHECGHAIDNAFDLRSEDVRQRVFGSSNRRYPTSYRPNPYSEEYVKNIPGGYAQSHPDEDFAETFAVWLDPQKNWKKMYRNWPAISKLLLMDRFMREIRREHPAVNRKGPVDPVSKNKMTLGSYWRKQQKTLLWQRQQARSEQTLYFL